MKIIYVANARIPTEKAHGIQIMKMCEAFADNGLEVELVVPKRFNTIKEDPFNYYGVRKVFKVKKLPCLDLIFLDRFLGNFPFWLQTCSFLLASKLYLVFRNYNVLYTRERLTGLFFKNFVLEIHSLPEKIRPMHLKVWRKAKSLVVLTGFIKKELIELGIPEKKILVSPDGVDVAQFDISINKEDARKILGLPIDKKLVGYVGMLKTLEMSKGVDVAIEAAGLFRDNTVLVIVGGTKGDIEFYKKFARDRGFQEKIIFVNKVSHNLIPKYLKAFDIVIAPFPSNRHYNFYMSPLKLFEYMASKRPIVATRLPSIKEVLNSENSILVAPGDQRLLAKGIETILEKHDLAHKLSEQAFKDVGNYTWQKRAESIIKFTI